MKNIGPTDDKFNDLTTVEGCAKEIADWLYSDSQVPVKESYSSILSALETDVENGARLPTETECELLVTGGDDGAAPEELVNLYPELDEALERFF